MEFTQLKYFHAVAKTGKIVTAAKSMFVTPPAISSAISQLERELGTPLFSRMGNRLVLNAQGKILLRYTNVILFHFGAAQSAILESLPESPMHISAVVTESHLLSDLIAAFSLRYPNHTVTLNSTKGSSLPWGAFQYRYAFLITTENNLTAQLAEECHCIPLLEDRPAILVAKEHPLAGKSAVRCADLKDYPLIHPKSYPDYLSRLSALWDDAGLAMPQVRSFSHLVCQTLASQNHAVCLTTMGASSADPEKFAYVPLEAPGIFWKTCLCWRKSRTLSPAEFTFLQFMSEFYGFSLHENEY